MLALAVALAGLLAGCPRDVVEPPRSPDAVPCDRNEDCNGGAACGSLRVCVDKLCEQLPSLVVPCGSPAPDAGG